LNFDQNLNACRFRATFHLTNILALAWHHRAAGLSGKLFNPRPAGTTTQAAF
jgi:hypothetical protein